MSNLPLASPTGVSSMNAPSLPEVNEPEISILYTRVCTLSMVMKKISVTSYSVSPVSVFNVAETLAC